MNTPTKTALIRFARVLIFGALASGIAWLMSNIGMIVPEKLNFIIPVVTAILSYIDKWIRENNKTG